MDVKTDMEHLTKLLKLPRWNIPHNVPPETHIIGVQQ